jgi:hypothetical protein
MLTPIDGWKARTEEVAAVVRDARAQESAKEAVDKALRDLSKKYKAKNDPAAVEWQRKALVALYQCAQACEEFTADDVWFALGAQYGQSGEMVGELQSVRGRSALGAVFRRARWFGWIEPTGRITGYDGSFTQRHRALLIWRSLIKSRDH